MEPEENQEENQEDPTITDELPPVEIATKPAPKNPGVCPSVRKGEACWALSRGKPCHYAIHGPNAEEAFKVKTSNVYVCHLPPSTSKEQLEAIFSPYGEITSVDILVDSKTREGKGVAFVHFDKPEDAESAIAAIDGLVLEGNEKPLECRLAKSNPKGGPGGRKEDGEDWECEDPTCAYLNFSRRTTCNKCGAPKSAARRRLSPPPRREGPYSRYEDDYYGPPRRGPRDYDEYGPRRPYYDDYEYGPRDYGRYGPPGRYYGAPPGRGGYGGGWSGPRSYDYGPDRPGYEPYGPRGYAPYGPPPGREANPNGGGPRGPYYDAAAPY